MARRYQKTGSRPAVRYLGLMSGLFVLVVLAAVFTVAVVQIQSGAAAYLAGQSIWSRGQVKTVLYLDAYAETGDPAMLARARRWHDIPLGDIQARKAMEAAPFDYDTAREGFLRGRIHPSDIPRLITLFRFFSQAPYFRDAVSAWQQSDQQILALGEIADQLESEWRAEEVALLRVKELRTELDRASRKLDHHALEFRRSMTRLARLMPTALSLASVVFFILFGVLAMTLTSRLTRALRDSERKFRATFEQAGMGIAQVAEDGRLLEVNQALCDILRYSRAELLKLSYPDLMHPEDKENGDEGPFTAISEAFQNHAIEQSLLCGDGSTVWAKLTVSRLQEQSGPQVCYIAIFEDVSESRRLSAELSYQASHDELTGLINRRAFERYLEDFLYRAHNDGSVHALCFIDLDQFKIINDTSGHFVGDYLLRQVAEAFSHHIRKGDLLARLGGDEFALILEHCDPDTAMTVAEKLRKSLIETTFAWDEQRFSIGCSIGVVPITATSVDTTNLLRMADAACYLAKERGRNRIHLAYEDDRELVERREQMEWVSRIRSALDEGRLFLDAQYIVSLVNPEQLHYEVLVRMTDDDGTILPPGAFLPAAERFDMAPLIDRWVVEHVFMQLRTHPVHLAQLEACHINISGRSFDQVDFLDFVVNMFEQYAIPPEKICFEITETAAVRNLNDARLFMERLGAMGCRFALDDFGAGLSSFGYLRQLPVDIIKIDGNFVRNLATDHTDRAMVNAINNIGQSLEKMIVAEFVEDNTALELLRGMGVHFAQGYAVHSPTRFAELIKDSALTAQG